jgi:toxin CcdB
LTIAQWDVYANPSARAREDIPYLVVVQSALLDQLPTRLVMPLSRSQAAMPVGGMSLAPEFTVAGERLRLKPHETGVMPAQALRRAVTNLKADSHRVVAALDTVISGV